MNDPRIRSILVGVDINADDGPDPVLAAALQIAAALGADVHVVHAIESGPLEPPLLPSLSLEVEAARGSLAHWLDEQLPSGAEVSSRHVELGRAHRVLADRIGEVAADLVIVGPHRGSPLGAAMLGTTTDRLLRTVRVPCWVVRGALAVPVKRVATATDFSALSRPALDLSFQLASGLGGAAGSPGTPPPDLDVLHVEWPAALVDDPEREQRVLQPQLATEIAAAEQRTGLAGAAVVHPLVVAAVDPSRGILSHARRERPDVTVLGTHGRGAVARTLLGAVASIVAREAPGHVVLVPPPEDGE